MPVFGIALLWGTMAILLHSHNSTESLKAARDTFKAVKRLQAMTEIGVTYSQYVDAVSTAWAEVSSFVSSPEGKTQKFAAISYDLNYAMEQYKYAIEPLRKKTAISELMDGHTELIADYDRRIQSSWAEAKKYIDGAERWLNYLETK
jgi:hypothetical protein